MDRLVAEEFDPVTGIKEQFYFNETINKVTVNRVQDIEGQAKFNRASYNSHDGKPSYDDSVGGAHHVARIPFIVIEQWKLKGFDWFNSTDNERRAMLNKSENRHLLVRPGQL